jgi:hypothetical protein
MRDLALRADNLPVSYDELIDSLDLRVVLRVDDNDYQGDTRMLLTDGRRWGLLIFGWGSCSGCDAFQAAEGDVAELVKLQRELWDGIHWEKSAGALLAYVEGKDWGLDYSWHEEAGRAFIAKVGDWLRSVA